MPPQLPGGQGGPCSAFANPTLCHKLIKPFVLLVFTDLTKSDSPRAPTMGFLHATKGSA
jgi:hypothetical protein